MKRCLNLLKTLEDFDNRQKTILEKELRKKTMLHVWEWERRGNGDFVWIHKIASKQELEFDLCGNCVLDKAITLKDLF